MRNLQSYYPFLKPLMKWIAKNYEIQSEPGLKTLLESYPQLVVVASHGSPLGWLPIPVIFSTEVVENGGGERVPLGVMHQFIHELPITKPLAQLVAQTEQRLGFEDLFNALQEGRATDIIFFPEGINCFTGDVSRVQPFKSPRFLELAVRAGVPILLIVHRGTEAWTVPIPLTDMTRQLLGMVPYNLARYFGRILDEGSHINFPLPPWPVETIRLKCEVYTPKLNVSQLSSDPHENRSLLESEAESIRDRMNEMLSEL